MSTNQQYITYKFEGVKSLCSFLEKNQNITHQIDELLRYFPMFDINREGVKYSFQICNGFSEAWETIMYTVIIIKANKLIGYGQLLLRESFAEIFNVIIDPNFRKKGVGSEIMTELEDYAVKHNKFSLALWCENHIQPFYTKLVYTFENKENIVDGVNLYRMSKQIQY